MNKIKIQLSNLLFAIADNRSPVKYLLSRYFFIHTLKPTPRWPHEHSLFLNAVVWWLGCCLTLCSSIIMARITVIVTVTGITAPIVAIVTGIIVALVSTCVRVVLWPRATVVAWRVLLIISFLSIGIVRGIRFIAVVTLIVVLSFCTGTVRWGLHWHSCRLISLELFLLHVITTQFSSALSVTDHFSTPRLFRQTRPRPCGLLLLLFLPLILLVRMEFLLTLFCWDVRGCSCVLWRSCYAPMLKWCNSGLRLRLCFFRISLFPVGLVCKMRPFVIPRLLWGKGRVTFFFIRKSVRMRVWTIDTLKIWEGQLKVQLINIWYNHPKIKTTHWMITSYIPMLYCFGTKDHFCPGINSIVSVQSKESLEDIENCSSTVEFLHIDDLCPTYIYCPCQRYICQSNRYQIMTN